MLRRTFVVAAALTLTVTAHAAVDDAEAIVKRATEKDALGLEGGHATITMTVTAEDGAQESKTFELWSKKKDGLLRTVVRFKAPAKIAGMAFLLLQRAGQADEQWVYLPAYKKARRITAKERTTGFAGSDLTYADLERRELKDAAHKKLADENIGKDLCHVIETVPKEKDGYARVVTWMRKTDEVPLRTQFFRDSGAGPTLEKTLFTRKVKTIDGKPVVVEARFERPSGKRATELRVDDATLKSDAPDSFFTVPALEGG